MAVIGGHIDKGVSSSDTKHTILLPRSMAVIGRHIDKGVSSSDTKHTILLPRSMVMIGDVLIRVLALAIPNTSASSFSCAISVKAR